MYHEGISSGNSDTWSQPNSYFLEFTFTLRPDLLMHMLGYPWVIKEPCTQVLRIWQQAATKQRDDRAILEMCMRHMLRYTQAKVLRTWSAMAQQKAGMRAKADLCQTRLASLRLQHSLNEWRSKAMYKREAKSMLKVCNTG